MRISTDPSNDVPSGATSARLARHRLINIDNGGTLTDICVMDGDQIVRTKTLTTPHDLSQCLFDGLRKASEAVYGKEDLEALLLSTAAIRYSTTQGTNALVERKGPRLGLVAGGALAVEQVRSAEGATDLFDAVIGSRAAVLSDESPEADVVRAVGELAAAGANRIVVSIGGSQREEVEQRLKRKLLRSFPPHLLGALPILYAHEVADDASDVRRTWTALFNAFLHPAMERFLYSAEQKLRDARAQSPLLVFRNDGYAGRVAKTIALKTYSSCPRGGMEGARVLAAHYGLKHLLSMDIAAWRPQGDVVRRAVAAGAGDPAVALQRRVESGDFGEAVPVRKHREIPLEESLCEDGRQEPGASDPQGAARFAVKLAQAP